MESKTIYSMEAAAAEKELDYLEQMESRNYQRSIDERNAWHAGYQQAIENVRKSIFKKEKEKCESL